MRRTRVRALVSGELENGRNVRLYVRVLENSIWHGKKKRSYLTPISIVVPKLATGSTEFTLSERPCMHHPLLRKLHRW